MNAFFLVISHQLRAWIIGVQLDLVDRGNDLARGVVEEFL